MDAACQTAFDVSTISTQTATASYRDQASQTYIDDFAFRNGLISSCRQSTADGKNIHYFNSIMKFKQRRNSSAEIMHRYHKATAEISDKSCSSSDSVFEEETREPSQKFPEYPREPLDLASTIILSEEIDTTQSPLKSVCDKHPVDIEKSARVLTSNESSSDDSSTFDESSTLDDFSTNDSMCVNIGEPTCFVNTNADEENSSTLFWGDNSALFSIDNSALFSVDNSAQFSDLKEKTYGSIKNKCLFSANINRNANDNECEDSVVSYTARDFENKGGLTATCEANYIGDNNVISINMNNFEMENPNLITSPETKNSGVVDVKENVNRLKMLDSHNSSPCENDESLLDFDTHTKIQSYHDMEHEKSLVRNATVSDSKFPVVSCTPRYFKNIDDAKVTCMTNYINDDISVISAKMNNFRMEDRNFITSSDTKSFEDEKPNVNRHKMLASHNFFPDTNYESLFNINVQTKMLYNIFNYECVKNRKKTTTHRNSNDSEHEICMCPTAKELKNKVNSRMACETNYLEIIVNNFTMSINMNNLVMEDRNYTSSCISESIDYGAVNEKENFNGHKILESHKSIPRKNDASLLSINEQKMQNNWDHEIGHDKLFIKNNNNEYKFFVVSYKARDLESTMSSETNYYKSNSDDSAVTINMNNFGIGRNSTVTLEIKDFEDGYKMLADYSLPRENYKKLFSNYVQIKLQNNNGCDSESPKRDHYFTFLTMDRNANISNISSIVSTQRSWKNAGQRKSLVPCFAQPTVEQNRSKHLKIYPTINTLPYHISISLDRFVSLQNFEFFSFAVNKIISSNEKPKFSIEDEVNKYCASASKNVFVQREVEILNSWQIPKVNLKVDVNKNDATNEKPPMILEKSEIQKLHDSIVEQKTENLDFFSSDLTVSSIQEFQGKSFANNPFKYLSGPNQVQKVPCNLDHVSCSLTFSFSFTDSESDFNDFLSRDYSIGNVIDNLSESILPKPKFASTQSNSAIVEWKSSSGGTLTDESTSFDNSFIEENLPVRKRSLKDTSYSMLDHAAEVLNEPKRGQRKSLEKVKRSKNKSPQMQKKPKTTLFENTVSSNILSHENEPDNNKCATKKVSIKKLENEQMQTSKDTSVTSFVSLINQDPDFNKKCEENEKNADTRNIKRKIKNLKSQAMPVRSSPRILKLNARRNIGKVIGSEESDDVHQLGTKSNSTQSRSISSRFLESSTQDDDEIQSVSKSVTFRKLPTTRLESIGNLLSPLETEQLEKKSSKEKMQKTTSLIDRSQLNLNKETDFSTTKSLDEKLHIKSECSHDSKSEDSIALHSRKDRTNNIPSDDDSSGMQFKLSQIKSSKLSGARPKTMNATRKKGRLEKDNLDPIYEKEENKLKTSRNRIQNQKKIMDEVNYNIRKMNEISYEKQQLDLPEVSGQKHKSQLRKLNPPQIKENELKNKNVVKALDPETEVRRLRPRQAKKTTDSKANSVSEKRALSAAKNSKATKKASLNSEAEAKENVDIFERISSKIVTSAREKVKVGSVMTLASNETRVIVPIVKKTKAVKKTNEAECKGVKNSENTKKHEFKKTLSKKKTL